MVKINAAGEILWDKVYGTTNLEGLGKIDITQDGGFVFAGTTAGPPQYDRQAYIEKVNAQGIVEWTQIYTDIFEIADFQQTQEGEYILATNTALNDSIAYKVFKLNKSGTIQWRKDFITGNGDSRVRAIIQSGDGGFVIGSRSDALAGGDKTQNSDTEDLWLVKIDANGNNQWDKTLVEPKWDDLSSIEPTADGGYILGGLRTLNPELEYSYNIEYLLVKLAPENTQLPQTPIRINAGGPDFTTATKKLFIADKYYAGIDRTSSIASGDILNTSNDVFYRSGRCSPSFSYNIPVVNGNFDVILHFAEIYYGAPGKKGGKGSRQFHVNIEGSRKLTNFDIFAAAGGAMRAYQQTFPVTVTDGVLNIDFLSGAADLPRISAIEVLPSQQPIQTFKPEADAMVRGGIYQNQNFGSDPLLDVKNGSGELLRTSYLRFAIPGVQQVKSAKLRIYGHNHQSSLAYVVAAGGVLNDTWTENGITFSNAPTWLNPTQQARAQVRGEWAYAELDVTEFVKTQAAGDHLVSFALTGASQRMVFHSKENPSGFVPQLVIVTDNTINPDARMENENEDAIEDNTALSSVIYPNPAKDHIMLEISPGHKSEVDLKLTNITGHQFQLQRPETRASSSKLKVGLPNQLPAGIYLLKVQSKEFSEVLKLLVTD